MQVQELHSPTKNSEDKEMKATLKDNILTVEMPLTEGKRSHSGKSLLVFTTGGFKEVPGTGLKISINVMSKRITA